MCLLKSPRKLVTLIAQIFIRKYILDLNFSNYVYFGTHALAKRSESRSDELELDIYFVFSSVCFWDLHLNFKEEHKLAGDSILDFKEVLLLSAIEVINQKATCIPVRLGQVKNFELDEGCLTSVDSCVVFILWYA